MALGGGAAVGANLGAVSGRWVEAFASSTSTASTPTISASGRSATLSHHWIALDRPLRRQAQGAQDPAHRHFGERYEKLAPNQLTNQNTHPTALHVQRG